MGKKDKIQKKDNKSIKKDTTIITTLYFIVAGVVIVFSILTAYIAGKQASKSSISNNNQCSPDDVKCIAAKATAKVPIGANPDGKPREVEKDCIDRHQQCENFARNGECKKNPGWMIVNCARSCKSCHLRDPKVRCTREFLAMDPYPVYKPGDMNRMFESITSKYGNKYNISILSTEPWVVVFENFLSDQEINALITTQRKWERSTDTGLTNEFGETGRILSAGRTSSNSWCDKACEAHPEVRKVIQKIEDITFVKSKNYESFQVLRYEVGQHYKVHHDFGHEDVNLACGPRILTFFLYLSDVDEGGETGFPELGIAVKPIKGRAVLWPSVLDDDLNAIDKRTMHEAKPVIKGLKFGANVWIHLYDFTTPNLWGCTGTFEED